MLFSLEDIILKIFNSTNISDKDKSKFLRNLSNYNIKITEGILEDLFPSSFQEADKKIFKSAIGSDSTLESPQLVEGIYEKELKDFFKKCRTN